MNFDNDEHISGRLENLNHLLLMLLFFLGVNVCVHEFQMFSPGIRKNQVFCRSSEDSFGIINIKSWWDWSQDIFLLHKPDYMNVAVIFQFSVIDIDFFRCYLPVSCLFFLFCIFRTCLDIKTPSVGAPPSSFSYPGHTLLLCDVPRLTDLTGRPQQGEDASGCYQPI